MFYTLDQMATEYMAYVMDGGTLTYAEYLTFNPVVSELSEAA